MDSLRVANTGFGTYHRIRVVNPLALFEASSITGNAVYGSGKAHEVKQGYLHTEICIACDC